MVTRNGEPLTVLYPEKRQYYVQHTTTTEAAIEMHYGSNILVALGEDLGAGKWSVRIQMRPLVNLVWLGAFIMALGGGIAASDRRYRTAVRTSEETAAVPGAAATHGPVGANSP